MNWWASPATGRALRDADGDEPAAEPTTGSLHLSKLPDGWWDLRGRLRPDQGDIVAAALDAQVDQRLRARRDGDPADAGLAVSALRADALVDLVAQTMRREPTDTSVPDRYREAVVVQPEQRPTSSAEPGQRTPSGATPSRAAPSAEHCDASFVHAQRWTIDINPTGHHAFRKFDHTTFTIQIIHQPTDEE